MPPVKPKQKKSRSSRARPYKYSRAKDEEVRAGMKDTSGLYQITQKVPKKSEVKAVSVEAVAAGLRAL
ncbi:unnamed protein product [Rhizoctonia solani]|uniref:Uncharacterized protein n=1 Tax=Rhizoctonia solani TaxID=456999 RepID=A0A8H3C1D4_9AGAM|nr:unnamed protein product [Rhizoctonia solani]